MNERQITIKLYNSEMRAILESVSRELERLKHINQSSEDEDEAADAGNDFMALSGLMERLADEAIATFGPQIATFYNERSK